MGGKQWWDQSKETDRSSDALDFDPEKAKEVLQKRTKGDQAIERVLRKIRNHPIAGYRVDDDFVDKVVEAMEEIGKAVKQVLRAISFPVYAWEAADTWENEIKKPNIAAKALIEKATSNVLETWKDDAAEVYERRSQLQSKAMETAGKIADDVKKHLQEIAKTIAKFYLEVVRCIASYIKRAYGMLSAISEISAGDVATLGTTEAIQIAAAIAEHVWGTVEDLASAGQVALDALADQLEAVTDLKGKVDAEFPGGWPAAVSSNMATD